MKLLIPVQQMFAQIRSALLALNDTQYMQKSGVLLNASIGKHVRHILELYMALQAGYETGIVNYDLRKRDENLENNRQLALLAFDQIVLHLSKPNRDLKLVADYDTDSQTILLDTNYYRELVYNIEHTVHHMALIRIGISALNIELPVSFGTATSTLKYQQLCAQ